IPSRPRRTLARRADLRPLAGRAAATGAHPLDVHPRPLPAAHGHLAPLLRARHDLRSLPFPREARGDRARPTIRLMEGSASVAADVLASYAADAAVEVEGVVGLVEGRLPRHGAVRVNGEAGAVTVELHVELAWGASAQDVGRE